MVVAIFIILSKFETSGQVRAIINKILLQYIFQGNIFLFQLLLFHNK